MENIIFNFKKKIKLIYIAWIYICRIHFNKFVLKIFFISIFFFFVLEWLENNFSKSKIQCYFNFSNIFVRFISGIYTLNNLRSSKRLGLFNILLKLVRENQREINPVKNFSGRHHIDQISRQYSGNRICDIMKINNLETYFSKKWEINKIIII